MPKSIFSFRSKKCRLS